MATIYCLDMNDATTTTARGTLVTLSTRTVDGVMRGTISNLDGVLIEQSRTVVGGRAEQCIAEARQVAELRGWIVVG